MKTLAQAARRVTRPEPGESPFRMPRSRSLTVEISTARAFIEEAEKRQEKFVAMGLPPTFISEFQALVDEFQKAVDVRLSSKTQRRQAQAGIATVLAQGFNVIRDLDVVVAIATRLDPIRFAAYQSARRIEGQGASASTTAKPPVVTPVVAPPEAPAGDPPTVVDTANPPAVPAATTHEVALVPVPEEVLGRAS